MNTGSTFKLEESARFLVLSNLFTMVVAVVARWDLYDVLLIYWGQSVVIGFFNWKRIRQLKQFSTDNLTIGNQPVAPTIETRNQIAFAFAVHYGLFHAAYLYFLCTRKTDFAVHYVVSGAGDLVSACIRTINLSRPDILGVLACIAVFAINHRFSFRHNLEKDLRRRTNIGALMFFPYARIIPMHVTIIFGAYFARYSMGILLLFLSLKTIMDLVMHLIEHGEKESK